MIERQKRTKLARKDVQRESKMKSNMRKRKSNRLEIKNQSMYRIKLNNNVLL